LTNSFLFSEVTLLYIFIYIYRH